MPVVLAILGGAALIAVVVGGVMLLGPRGPDAARQQQLPTDAELDQDINQMRDEYLADVRRQIDEATPSTAELRTRQEVENYRRLLRQKNEPVLKEFERKVETLRPQLRELARRNWTLARADRQRLLLNRVHEKPDKSD